MKQFAEILEEKEKKIRSHIAELIPLLSKIPDIEMEYIEHLLEAAAGEAKRKVDQLNSRKK